MVQFMRENKVVQLHYQNISDMKIQPLWTFHIEISIGCISVGRVQK